MEEMWQCSPAMPLLARLGLPLEEAPAHSSVLVGSRLHPFDPAAGGTAFLDGLLGCGRVGFDAFRYEARRLLEVLGGVVAAGSDAPAANGELAELRSIDFAAFVDRFDLAASAGAWLRLLVESESAVGWERISALDGLDELRPFIAGRGDDGCPNVRVVGGNEQLITALSWAVGDDDVRTSSPVLRIDDRGGHVDVVHADRRGRRRTERAALVMVTVPSWALGTVQLRPGLTAAAQRAIATTGAGTYVKVVLRVRADNALFDGLMPSTVLTGGAAGCVYLADGAVAGRDHVVTMLLHGRHAKAVTGRAAPAVAARTIDALAEVLAVAGDRPCGAAARRIADDLRAAVTDARVFDHPRAVATWPVALGRSRFDDLAAALRRPQGRGNVLIGGDTTETSHSDGAVRAGLRMAQQAMARLGADALAVAS